MKNLLYVVSLVLVFITPPAFANINDELSKLFDDMVTSSAPAGTSETQRRGVFNGGSFYARSKVLKVNLLTFEPPSLGGLTGPTCNGINFYGGSITFIKKDQIVAFLRSIASNAAGYIFTLALSSACDKCAQWMSAFQKTIEKLNNTMKDSCHAAKMLLSVEKIDKDAPASNTKAEESWLDQRIASVPEKLADGNAWDYFFGDNAPKDSKKDVLDAEKEFFDSNPLWEAIKRQDVKEFFSENNVDMANAIHSFIGPIVAVWTPPGPGDRTLEINHLPATVEFKDLYRGSGGEKLDTWGCTLGNNTESSNSDSCLRDFDTGAGTGVEILGMHEYVKRIVLGGEIAGVYTDGILSKFQNNGPALTNVEKVFIDKTRIPIAAMLRRISESGMPMPQLVDAMIEYVALNLTEQWAFEAVNAVRAAVGKSDVELKATLNKRMLELKESIRKQVAAIKSDTSTQKDLVQLYHLVMKTTLSHKVPIATLLNKQTKASSD